MNLLNKTAWLTTLMIVALASIGCQASATFSAGTTEAKKPEAPPPPKPKEDSEPAAEPPAEEPAVEPEPEPEPEPAEQVVTKGDSILVPGAIVFDSGQSTLTAGAPNDEILAQLKAYLDKYQNVTLMRIEGHTDNVGTPEDNLKLSGERALAIKTALVGRGVDTGRLLAVGFGERKPIADNATEEGKAQNRRTEFKIAGLNGKNYLGLDPLGGGQEFK